MKLLFENWRIFLKENNTNFISDLVDDLSGKLHDLDDIEVEDWMGNFITTLKMYQRISKRRSFEQANEWLRSALTYKGRDHYDWLEEHAPEYSEGWKQLIENWHQHLKEQDVPMQTKRAKPKSSFEPEEDEYAAPYETAPEKTKETYFGKNPEDIECIKNFRDPEWRNWRKFASPMDFYRCMKEAGYEKLGAGAFRAVFSVPGRDNLVLKTVSPMETSIKAINRNKQMNYVEARGSYQTASELVPKVYDAADDYLWILSEKVTPIEYWIDMQEYFPKWKDEYETDFVNYFHKLIGPDRDEERLVKVLNNDDPDGEMSFRRIEALEGGTATPGKELVNDPLILAIRDLLAQFKGAPWDIRPHNVGYAIRNGKTQFVVLDPGIGL